MDATATHPADDRAVSPVVGSILMVAIVVVLAMVVGAMALSFGDTLEQPAPVISFDSEYQADGAGNGGKPYINVTFESGQTVDGADLLVKDGDGNSVAWEDVWTGASHVDTPNYVHIDGHMSDGDLNPICEAGQTYYVISESGGDQRIIYEVEIPRNPGPSPLCP